MELAYKFYHLVKSCEKEIRIYKSLRLEMEKFDLEVSKIRKSAVFDQTISLSKGQTVSEINEIISELDTRRKNLDNIFQMLKRNCKHVWEYEYTDYHKNEDYHRCINCQTTM